MEIHLTQFPEQKTGEELVLTTLAGVGSSGVTDWVDEYGGKLCRKSSTQSCVKLPKARVQVLHYSCCHFFSITH